MRVVVPHVGEIPPEVTEHLGEHFPYPVDRDYEAYWRLLSLLWAAGRDFMIVEHDVVLPEGVVDEMEACPEEWCTFGYPYPPFGIYHGLGAVRFRAELLERCPDVMEEVGLMRNPTHPPRHWCTLDAFTQVALRKRGAYMHRHPTVVGHLNTSGPAHGCLNRPQLVP